MSQPACQSPETGLRDVFDILRKAASERLHSLTIQLGESSEEKIIHALCLVLLQRPTQALAILQTLEDDSLACHLAEHWPTGQFHSEAFGDHCSRFRALTGETLAALARIFRVLMEVRLCDQLQRDLAYKRAITSNCQKTSTYDDLHYDQFREEAKDVCGPQVVEWMCSSTGSGSYSSSHTRPDGGSATLRLCENRAQLASTQCLPTTLQASSSLSSFPTHLEVSIPSTVSFRGDKLNSQLSGNHKLGLPSLKTIEARNTPQHSELSECEPTSAESPQCAAKKDSIIHETPTVVSCNSNPMPHKTSIQPECAQPAISLLPKMPAPREAAESTEEEEEEEETFYAFVILHAPDDTDVAESMKEKVEGVVGADGATFSGDFAIPGRSTLKCVEDAINNSAFTFLLLTRNFNTRMLDVKTNAALMNSINNRHKYNTVIPLLPRENRMPRTSIPLVLQTIVPLEENRSFEKKIQKSLAPSKIEKQRRRWLDEQTLRKQEKLQVSQHAHIEDLRLSIEQKLLVPERWPHPANICIQNARYIMIGNDSQMTVGVGESADIEGEQRV